MAQEEKAKYYIVEARAMPAVLMGVIRAKELLETGQAQTIGKAVENAGISRSAFYKYRECVSPFLDKGTSRIITFHIILRNRTGLLSTVLLIFANYGANILTINQSIPVSGRAVVTISAETRDVSSGLDGLIEAVEAEDGVRKIEIISG